jgi:hypothetical protein
MIKTFNSLKLREALTPGTSIKWRGANGWTIEAVITLGVGEVNCRNVYCGKTGQIYYEQVLAIKVEDEWMPIGKWPGDDHLMMGLERSIQGQYEEALVALLVYQVNGLITGPSTLMTRAITFLSRREWNVRQHRRLGNRIEVTFTDFTVNTWTFKEGEYIHVEPVSPTSDKSGRS